MGYAAAQYVLQPVRSESVDTTWIWLVSGLALMAFELVAPGLVVIFMGMSAVLVAGLQWIGILESLPASLATWMGLSVALVAVLRRVIARYIPAEVRRDHGDDELLALGKEVEVITDCTSGNQEGRIRFQGTSWPARTIEGAVPAGKRARLLYRDNLSWIVEPIEIDEQYLLDEPDK